MKKIFIPILLTVFFTTNLHAGTYTDIRTFLDNGKPDAALAKIIALDEDSKSTAEVDFLFASAYQQKNDLPNSIKYANSAVTKAPDVSEYQMIFAESQGLLMQQGGGVFGKMGQAKRMRKAFQKAVKLDPNNLRARSGLSQFYLMAPGIVGGSKKKALVQAKAIYAQNKEMAYPLLVQIYQKQKQTPKAREVLAEWQSNDTENWNAIIISAFLEQGEKNYAKSYELLANWIKKNPKHLPAQYQMGRLAAISGEYLDDGEKGLLFYLSRPVENSQAPGYEHAHRRIAMVYQHKNDIEKAKAHVNQGLKVDPKNKSLLKLNKEL